jgi:hypothetical protein
MLDRSLIELASRARSEMHFSRMRADYFSLEGLHGLPDFGRLREGATFSTNPLLLQSEIETTFRLYL